MSDGLGQFTDDQLRKAQAGDLSGFTTEQLMALRAALATPAAAPMAQQAPAPVEPQRMRSMAQGLLLGGADEAEAYLRSLAGENYDAALADIRKKTEAYQQAEPGAALGYEVAGGLLPTAAAMFTPGAQAAAPAAIARTAPMMSRLAGMAARGAGIGGVTAFNTGESDVIDRLSRVPMGAAVGAVAAPVVSGVIGGGGFVVDKLMDSARRLTGDRGAKIVETEIQRIVRESGMTPEQVVQGIVSGNIMAENATMSMAVRGMYAKGGEAATTIQKGIEGRPDMLRGLAVSEMQQRLAGQPGNVMAQYKLSDAAAKQVEEEAYTNAFGKGGVISPLLLSGLTDALKRSPQSVKNINELYVAQTGKKPFFSFNASGDVEFSRAPTLEDAEIIRRGIQTSVNEAYTGGRGAVGEALKNVEGSLRAAIDNSSKALADARAQAAARRSTRDAFAEGRKIFGKSADEAEIYFNDLLTNPASVDALRAGVMDALRNKMSTGQRASMMATLANPESKEGRILRTIYPQDDLPGILSRLELAAQSQRTKNVVLGGSSTAPTQGQAARVGMDISAEELMNITNPMTAMRVLGKFINKQAPNLNEEQRNAVAKVMVSSDPQLVQKAIIDNSAMALLQQKVNTAVKLIGTQAGRRAAYMGAERIPTAPAGLLGD
jgi:hypothetical protein